LEERVRTYLEQYHQAVMATLRPDGTPHVARVAVGLVDGRLWSSGTQDRLRTKHLRRDPRATLCVLDGGGWRWLGLETRVRILDGPEAVEQNLALYRVLAGDPKDLDEYRRAMVAERRLIYDFEIERAYGEY
jgi:PPOX class probable F420-dependent enzyme